METFSYDLFMESGWGTLLFAVVLVVAAGLGIVSVIALSIKLDETKVPSLVRFVAYGLALFGLPMAIFMLLPSRNGEVTALSIATIDGERVVLGDFTWMASGGRGAAIRNRALRRFRVRDGAELGSLHLQGGLLVDGCSKAWTIGRARICEDSLEVLDAVTFEEIAALEPMLDERFGPGAYRVTTFEDGALSIERQDGVHEAIPLTELGVPTEPLEHHPLAACTAAPPDGNAQVTGLLRAIPCDLGDARLVLHRQTAFGDGAHLVSWVGPQGTRWTTSLQPWMADDSDELRLLSPRVQDGEVLLWLLREKVSLVEVVLDAEDGTPLRSDVVF